MEDYVYQIRKYLPIKFTDNDANDFVKYLEETYLENLKNKKYQFSFIAFHMLYMTFCYKTEWFLKEQNNLKITQDLQQYISKNKRAFFNVLFDLSQFSEKDTFNSLLTALKGFNSNDIDNCRIHVTKRNHCAHASGRIQYAEKDIDYLSSDELKYVEKIQNKILPTLMKFFEEFLNNNWDRPLIGGDVENLFTVNNISGKDLELITGVDLPLFHKNSDNQKIVFQKIAYLVFVSEAQKYIEPEKNTFLEKLPMFILGLRNEIKVRRDGEEKLVPKREIIEEHLVPIISKFADKDRQLSEKILGL